MDRCQVMFKMPLPGGVPLPWVRKAGHTSFQYAHNGTACAVLTRSLWLQVPFPIQVGDVNYRQEGGESAEQANRQLIESLSSERNHEVI